MAITTDTKIYIEGQFENHFKFDLFGESRQGHFEYTG